MKQLCQAKNALEADELRRFLSVRGIDARVEGGTTGGNSIPSVLVDDAELDHASELLAQFKIRLEGRSLEPEWTCCACAEVVEAEFDACTKCNVPRGEAAPSVDPEPEHNTPDDTFSGDEAQPIKTVVTIVPGANRSAWSLWFELVIVLAFVTPLFGGRSLVGMLISTMRIRNSYANFYLPSVLKNVFAVAFTLIVIWVSGDPWSAFGIKKPMWLDVLTGCIICFISGFATMMGVDIFVDILKSIYNESYVHQLTRLQNIPYRASGVTGFVVLLLLAIVIGTNEELVMRGYLIPRLERLLGSTWVSVTAGAAIFGLLHSQLGSTYVCDSFLAGIFYGIAFALTRRLWPVVIAHAMYDLAIFLHQAS